MNINMDIDRDGGKQVLSVSDFCRRYRLDDAEEKRLLALFGNFATRMELLMNAERRPVFR